MLNYAQVTLLGNRFTCGSHCLALVWQEFAPLSPSVKREEGRARQCHVPGDNAELWTRLEFSSALTGTRAICLFLSGFERRSSVDRLLGWSFSKDGGIT